ncbi:hypothetical protein RZO55_16655 [Clostridium boliviensis]|uniref:Uncharacterized protein n=1 Tax=Clostridium boliviensis TaxID=318465 RepID=A0ABU4GNL7_9CLOT|nr:hypothetical protein [Clostridium boliviensis]MDW2799206.1 hypothetical protein [Clostridium boliviensis]
MSEVGNWVLEEFTPCELPKEVADGFEQVMSKLVGVRYTPLLYAATQIVAGKNHMIICKSIPAVLNPQSSLVSVYLHEALPVDGGDFQLLSVQQIKIGI